MGPKDLTEIEVPRFGVQVMLRHKVGQIAGPKKVGAIGQIDFLHQRLVRRDGVAVIRDPHRGPVVTPGRFEVPDFIFIVKGNTVAFAGAVFFQQGAQALGPFLGTLDVRQDQCDHGLFVDAVIDERVVTQNASVGRRGFRGAHAHVKFVDPGFFVLTIALVSLRRAGVTVRVIR